MSVSFTNEFITSDTLQQTIVQYFNQKEYKPLSCTIIQENSKFSFILGIEKVENNLKPFQQKIQIIPILENQQILITDTSLMIEQQCLKYNKFLDIGSFCFDAQASSIMFQATFQDYEKLQKRLQGYIYRIQHHFNKLMERCYNFHFFENSKSSHEIIPESFDFNEVLDKYINIGKEIRKTQPSDTTQLINQGKQFEPLDIFFDKKTATKIDNGGFHDLFLITFSSQQEQQQYIIKSGARNPEKIQHEIKIFKQISSQSEYIVKAYKATQYKTDYLMEYCQFKSLRNFVNQTSFILSLETKLQILYQIAQGIQHLHSYQVIHLDLKPDNILVNADFIPKISDFGESYHPNYSSVVSLSYSVPYKAPECFQPYYKPDPQSDVFSLGVIIWELIFNQLPINFSLPQVYRERFRARTYEIEFYHYLLSLGPKYILEAIIVLSIQCSMQTKPKERPLMKNIGDYLQKLHQTIYNY